MSAISAMLSPSAILSEVRVNARASRRTPVQPLVTMPIQGVRPKRFPCFSHHPIDVGLVFVAPLHCATACGARKIFILPLLRHDFAGFARCRSRQPWRSSHALLRVARDANCSL